LDVDHIIFILELSFDQEELAPLDGQQSNGGVFVPELRLECLLFH
jgi:hypothetical protein